MGQLLLPATLLLVAFGVGRWPAQLLPGAWADGRRLAAPALGLAITSVVVTVAYRHGLSTRAGLLACAAVALAGLAAELRGAWAGRPAWALPWRWLAWLAALALLLAPGLIGGPQFTLFRGNQWDAFGYLDAAIAYSRHGYQAVLEAGNAELLRDPLLTHAQGNLAARPSVHLLFAALGAVAPVELHRLPYAFLATLLAIAAAASLALVGQLAPQARRAGVVLAALAFPLGFWGQYTLDIDAWSQVAAAPLALLLAGVLALMPLDAEGEGGRAAGWRAAGAAAVLVAGLTYLYPEQLLFLLFAVLPAAGLVALRRGGLSALGWQAARSAVALCGAATGLLFPEGTVRFVATQLATTAGAPVSWWQYFQAFLGGRDGWSGRPLEDGVDLVAGLLGLYHLTPPAGGAAVALGIRVALGVAVLGLLTGAVGLLRHPSRAGRALDERGGWGASALGLTVLISLVPMAVLARGGHYWPAGKAVAWMSPIFMLLLALPALRPAGPAPAAGSWTRAAAWLALAFGAVQLGLGGWRLQAARAPDGLFAAPPYPVAQEPLLKTERCWDVDALAPLVDGARGVVLAPMDAWSQNLLIVWLSERGIPYATSLPVRRNFTVGDAIGRVETTAPIDTIIAVVERGFEVQHRDEVRPRRVRACEP